MIEEKHRELVTRESVVMEPVAWVLPTLPKRIVDHMSFNANYGGTVEPLYSAEQLSQVQRERDELLTVLEQVQEDLNNDGELMADTAIFIDSVIAKLEGKKP